MVFGVLADFVTEMAKFQHVLYVNILVFDLQTCFVLFQLRFRVP
jgi:hypothetical protein